MDWQNLIIALLGLGFVGDVVLHWLIPARRRKDDAGADLAENDADKAEVERLHLQISHQQESLEVYIRLAKESAERIAELGKDNTDKTAQIRHLTAQLIDSEHGRNADKEEIARLAAALGDARRQADYHRDRPCERPHSRAPPRPRPPPDAQKGRNYSPPEQTGGK